MTTAAILSLPRSPAFSTFRPQSFSSNLSESASQPRRIAVRLAHRHTKPAAQPLDLQLCIRTILAEESNQLPATREAIYAACYREVCVRDRGGDLHHKLRKHLDKACDVLARDMAKKEAPQTAHEAAEWINNFVQKCAWFEKQTAALQSMLCFLDQAYATRAKESTIRELAFTAFTKAIFQSLTIMNALRVSIKVLLDADRAAGSISDQVLCISTLFKHLATHSQFIQFEEYYLAATAQFYEADSDLHAGRYKDDAKSYFEHLQLRLNVEMERSKKLIPAGSWAAVREAALKPMLNNRTAWVAETLGNYLEMKDFGSLEALNQLFSEVDQSKVLCAAFKSHILNTVHAIVKDPKGDDTMVQRLLDLHSLAESAVQSCFVQILKRKPDVASTSELPKRRPKQSFVYALSDAFQSGFRARKNKPAEMIARHLDKLMRKGQGTKSGAEYNTLLDQALGLYRFTDDKDVFRGFYLRGLAKRLLLEKSADDKFEKEILLKLKKGYDPEFSMGDEMFKDLGLSHDLITEYHRKQPQHSSRRALRVMVLQQGAWPYTQQIQPITLPRTMQEDLSAYERFYKDKHNGRSLHWQPSVGTMTLHGYFPLGKKEISVSLYQGTILLLFNDAAELSVADIGAATQLEDSLLRLTLQSLACGKKRVLVKEPVGRDVNDGDIFRFNDQFRDTHAKVHINSIQAKVSAEESKQTQNAIDGERAASLDAAIVRVMKAKKEMMHAALVTAIIDAVKNHFKPDVGMIKGRIEKLIEQEYMRRDEATPNKFFYVA